MVARKRTVLGSFSIKRFTATVINDIAVEVFFFTAWAAGIVAIDKYRTPLGISPQMLTVLGTVLGLVVSFRTTSAYDRYWEGRKLWSSLTLASRNLAQIIWIQIPTERKPTAENPNPKDAKLRAVIEKKTMVNLVQAFSVAVKHYLRGETGIFYEDLYPLVSFLPKHAPGGDKFQSGADTLPIWHADENTMKRISTRIVTRTASAPPAANSSRAGSEETTADPEKDVHDSSSGPKLPPNVKLLPSRMPPKESIYDYVPILLPIKPIISLAGHYLNPNRERSGRDWLGRRIRKPISVTSNVPLEINLFLSSYLAYCLQNDLLKPAPATAFINGITAFQDAQTSLERVRSTPIPFAYQMHLRMTIWLYLLFLPFQIILSLNWVTVPATAFAAFLFLGFLEIGAEIEDPFDYDQNDLDLDHFCEMIERELSEITAHPVVDPSTFIFSNFNQPLAPGDYRSAKTIIENTEHAYHHEDTGLNSVRRTLLESWRTTNEVDEKGRHV